MKRIITIIIMVGIAALPAMAAAAISGPCSACHTMHYSQDGTTPSGASGGPNNRLLLNTCIGCHTGTNSSPGSGNPPYVLDTSEPNYGTGLGTGTGTESSATTLAGGNFYWVADTGGNDDTTGHNVNGISGADANFSGDTIPGSTVSYDSWNSGNGLNCAGTYGCHGLRDTADNDNAMTGTHHGDATANRTADNYRFLEYDGVGIGSTTGDTTAIDGLEDPDWEFQPTTSAHNQYKGAVRSSDDISDYSTISAFCASCHGNFHNNGGTAGTGKGTAGTNTWDTDPWIRHPVDYEMAYSGEFQNYNGATSNSATYSLIAPVASSNVSSVLSTVTIGGGAGETIVMCLSCHRAHGTPFADMLRWDYSSGNCQAGTADSDCGCFICHTGKD